LPRAPVVTRLREPGLWQSCPSLERHRVQGGGMTVITLAAGGECQASCRLKS
jgi:hypothetical protein